MSRPSPKYRKWLLRELSNLEQKGVVSAEARSRIETHYEDVEIEQSTWITTTLCSLGALLIGGGIILLFAHNWEALDRTTRAVLSVTPLCLAALCSWWALDKNYSAREASGIFHTISVGAGIALIGQTYHLSGNTPAFLLSWALLTIPLVFLLSSNGSFLIYLGLILGWCFAAQEDFGHAVGFWALLIPALVRVFQLIKRNRHATETLLSSWALCLTLVIALGVVMERTIPGLWIIVYASFLSLVGLLGLVIYPDKRGWKNPLGSTGVLGVSILTYVLSWYDVWENIGWSHRREFWEFQQWGIWTDIFVTLLIAIGWVAFAVRSFKPQFGPALVLSIFPFLAVLCFFLATTVSAGHFLSGILFNLFMFGLGTAYLIDGCKKTRLRDVNFGMLLLGLLILTRFFDGDFGFLARGFAFISIGVSFLLVNRFIFRRRNPHR